MSSGGTGLETLGLVWMALTTNLDAVSRFLGRRSDTEPRPSLPSSIAGSEVIVFFNEGVMERALKPRLRVQKNSNSVHGSARLAIMRLRFNEAKVTQAAAVFLKLRGGSMSYMKL